MCPDVKTVQIFKSAALEEGNDLEPNIAHFHLENLSSSHQKYISPRQY